MAKQVFINKGLFITSGVLATVFASLGLMIMTGGASGVTVPYIALIHLTFLFFGIVTLAKKNNILTFIALGLISISFIALMVAVFLNIDPDYFFYDNTFIQLLAFSLVAFITTLYTLMLSIVSYINPSSRFIKTWFIPTIFLAVTGILSTAIGSIINDSGIEAPSAVLVLYTFINLIYSFFCSGLQKQMNRYNNQYGQHSKSSNLIIRM